MLVWNKQHELSKSIPRYADDDRFDEARDALFEIINAYDA